MTNQLCHKGRKNRHKTLFMTFLNNVMYSASQKVPRDGFEKVPRDGFVKTSQINTIYDVSQPSQNHPKPIQPSLGPMLMTKKYVID